MMEDILQDGQKLGNHGIFTISTSLVYPDFVYQLHHVSSNFRKLPSYIFHCHLIRLLPKLPPFWVVTDGTPVKSQELNYWIPFFLGLLFMVKDLFSTYQTYHHLPGTLRRLWTSHLSSLRVEWRSVSSAKGEVCFFRCLATCTNAVPMGLGCVWSRSRIQVNQSWTSMGVFPMKAFWRWRWSIFKLQVPDTADSRKQQKIKSFFQNHVVASCFSLLLLTWSSPFLDIAHP